MCKRFHIVILIFFATVCLTNCLPISISSPGERYRRAYIYDINGIDHQDDTSSTNNTTSEEEVAGILLLDETESNPWDTLVLSLRNGFPPPDRDRRRFSHFYKNKPNEPPSNIDPIVFPTISDEPPTIIYTEEAATQSSYTTIDASSERTAEKLTSVEDNVSSSSQSSSTETEMVSETENSKISLDILSTWLWENRTPSSLFQSTIRPTVSDIGTHSLYHGPKIKKGRLGKIECPPGQRPNHFGECKRPITLKQSDYE